MKVLEVECSTAQPLLFVTGLPTDEQMSPFTEWIKKTGLRAVCREDRMYIVQR